MSDEIDFAELIRRQVTHMTCQDTIATLKAENEALKIRLQGRTYYHDNPQVEEDCQLIAKMWIHTHRPHRWDCTCVVCTTARKYIKELDDAKGNSINNLGSSSPS